MLAIIATVIGLTMYMGGYNAGVHNALKYNEIIICKQQENIK